MTFPVTKTIESALSMLDIAIQHADQLGEGAQDALEATKKKYRWRDKTKPPKDINRKLLYCLKDHVHDPDLEATTKHLAKLLDVILPIQAVMEQSKSGAKMPRYGWALSEVVYQIRSILFEWDCFEKKQEAAGIPKNGEIKFIPAQRTLSEIKNTGWLDIYFQNDANAEMYFGLGEADSYLYLKFPPGTKEFPNGVVKLCFQNHSVLLLDCDNQKRGEKSLSNNNFHLIANSLLADFMGYSKDTRMEAAKVDEAFKKPEPEPRRTLKNLPSVWLKLLGMSEEFLSAEAGNANWPLALFGVSVTAIIVVCAAILVLPLYFKGISSQWLSINLTTRPVMFIGILFVSILGVILIILLGIGLINGIIFGIARLLGGKGDFKSQLYLQSVYLVPIAILIFLVVLFSSFPILLGYTQLGIIFLLIVYALILWLKTVKVTHKLPLKKLVFIFAIPVLLFVLVILGITLLNLVA